MRTTPAGAVCTSDLAASHLMRLPSLPLLTRPPFSWMGERRGLLPTDPPPCLGRVQEQDQQAQSGTWATWGKSIVHFLFLLGQSFNNISFKGTSRSVLASRWWLLREGISSRTRVWWLLSSNLVLSVLKDVGLAFPLWWYLARELPPEWTSWGRMGLWSARARQCWGRGSCLTGRRPGWRRSRARTSAEAGFGGG